MQLLTNELVAQFTNNSRFWYLATPYTKYHRGLDEACRMACIASAELIKKGMTIFCPIAHSHYVAMYGDINPLDAEFWITLDKKFLAIASGLIVLDAIGWQESDGVAQEIAEINRLGKPIYLLGWDDVEFTIKLN